MTIVISLCAKRDDIIQSQLQQQCYVVFAQTQLALRDMDDFISKRNISLKFVKTIAVRKYDIINLQIFETFCGCMRDCLFSGFRKIINKINSLISSHQLRSFLPRPLIIIHSFWRTPCQLLAAPLTPIVLPWLLLPATICHLQMNLLSLK